MLIQHRVYVFGALWALSTPLYAFSIFDKYNESQRRWYLLAMAMLITAYIHALAMSQNLALDVSLPYLMPCTSFASWMAGLLVDAMPERQAQILGGRWAR
jgi:hypothetical protein